MFNKERTKGFITGIIFSLLLSLFTVSTFAAPLGKKIEVFFNNIKLVVDGQKVEFGKDDNGNRIEPFIYNGTTYLPIRAVGEAIGKTVDWDGETKTVYIGKKNQNDEEAVYVGNGIEHMNYQESDNANGAEFFNYYYNYDTAVTDNVGNKYNNFITLGTHGSWGLSFKNSWNYLDFPTNGRYRLFKTTIGWPSDMKSNEVPAIVSIYADDKLIYEKTMEPGDFPEDISLDITGALKVRIKLSIPDYTNKTFVGFYNARFIK